MAFSTASQRKRPEALAAGVMPDSNQRRQHLSNTHPKARFMGRGRWE